MENQQHPGGTAAPSFVENRSASRFLPRPPLVRSFEVEFAIDRPLSQRVFDRIQTFFARAFVSAKLNGRVMRRVGNGWLRAAHVIMVRVRARSHDLDRVRAEELAADLADLFRQHAVRFFALAVIARPGLKNLCPASHYAERAHATRPAVRRRFRRPLSFLDVLQQQCGGHDEVALDQGGTAMCGS